jgi:hypothetical protein
MRAGGLRIFRPSRRFPEGPGYPIPKPDRPFGAIGDEPPAVQVEGGAVSET